MINAFRGSLERSNASIAASELTDKQKKDQVVGGFLQIIERFKKILKSQKIEEIKAVGKKFDPALHEAIAETKGGKSGFVVEEVEKGYMRNGVLLRPSKVKVAK